MARKRMGVVQRFKKAQTIQKVNFVIRKKKKKLNTAKPIFNQCFTPIPPETSGFLMFSVGAEVEHRLNMS